MRENAQPGMRETHTTGIPDERQDRIAGVEERAAEIGPDVPASPGEDNDPACWVLRPRGHALRMPCRRLVDNTPREPPNRGRCDSRLLDLSGMALMASTDSRVER